ncbi:uncharacterized protein B0H64DRAFT_381886 [Chaetomium fimeti]|uniref:DUF7730 domain-containing protein n=1 Tax=Chaetomium fimeti TaxID=1854472 RepID=A0AAE0LX45_9PEZI|nr:hypothetical protein B0H64DRAFT_381886 [Chaetomium fimeti]
MAADNNIGGLPGILRLTSDTRRRIYLHAGLAYQDHDFVAVPGVYNLGERTVERRHEIDQRCRKFHGLLLSCPTIYAEASTVLYSANWFLIRYQARRSLAPLRSLTPHSLAHLANLKIILNQTSCHEEQQTGEEGHGECCDNGTVKSTTARCDVFEHDHDLPLYTSDSRTEAVLAEWHATATYLAAHIVPGQLELTLVCDVHHENVETAKLVLDSLRLLPRLKDCHIRLCRIREPQLQQLAQDAVLRARGLLSAEHLAASSGSAPRLINLPRELQLRILEHTDLVTPHKEVMWRRGSHGYYRASAGYYTPGTNRPPEIHHGYQFICCVGTPWPHPSNGCCCRQRHAAVSSRCKCWAPPTPLFRVCRTLYLEANRVLYSENRFIVIETPFISPFAEWGPGDYPYSVFAASQFLRHVVPRHCLQHIRFLELVFAPFSHLSKPRNGHPALQDWSDTLNWVKQELNLPGLTLRLIMVDEYDEGLQVRREITRAQGKEVLAFYNSILLPIRCLNPVGSEGGLARFYTQMRWPLRWTEWARSKIREKEGWGWLESKERELKRRTEQAIMGERYERVCVAAKEPKASLWTWACPNDSWD